MKARFFVMVILAVFLFHLFLFSPYEGEAQDSKFQSAPSPRPSPLRGEGEQSDSQIIPSPPSSGARVRVRGQKGNSSAFQLGGSLGLGYRFTDIDGRNRYKEVINLSDGPRLFDFSLWGEDNRKKGLADSFSFKLKGIGDPFPSGRFEVKKNQRYDLVATYREYKYFFDREDEGILTDNHDFNQRRRRGALTLTLFPRKDFRLSFGFSQTQRDGEARVPRPFVFNLLGIPNLKQDLRERLNEYFGSADFSLGGWDVHLKQSFWNFESRDRIEEDIFVEKREEQVKTYVSTLKGHRQIGERWDLDAGYIYAHSKGRAGNFTTFPASLVSSGKGEFHFHTHIVEMGLSHLISQELIAHFDHRFHRFDQDGGADTDLIFPNASTAYALRAHTGTVQFEYFPKENLTLRAGYRFQYREIDGENFLINAHDGGEAPQDTRTRTHGWIGSTDWKPYKFLGFYGEYQGADFDNPFTRISPDHENIARLRVRYDSPLKGLQLKGTALWKRRTNPDQDFRIDIKDYTLSAAYQPASVPNLTLEASFTYEKIQDSKDIFDPLPPSFLRFSFDSDALIYTGGVSYEGLYKGLGARFYGSLARSRKENSQEYADGALSFWYQNQGVTPVLTLERTYLIDRERGEDGFDANLLTFSLRKEF